jgi:hypothetical protein
MADTFFSATNTVALLAWIALVLFPARRAVSHVLCAILVPAALAISYAAVIGWKMTQDGPPPGDVMTLGGLKGMFADDWVFAAAWAHYLVFDMVVGAWIARDAVRLGIPWPLRTISLLLTFLLGPVGFLLHVITRFVLRRAVATDGRAMFDSLPQEIVMRSLLGLVFILAFSGSALAERAVFTLLKTVKAAELTRIMDEERTAFLSTREAHPDYVLPPRSTAANDVELYAVRYDSVIPELGNRKITASGLLALPVLPDRSRLPSIIYRHGTVFGKYEVPSYSFKDKNPTAHPHYDGAYETRFMVGLFAGNGYAVMAADYFGMGDGADAPEAYFVKASTQQASYDFYLDALEFMESKKITPAHLFVGGWSQGGLNATGLLEKLERKKVLVAGTFTASSPSDPFAALNGLMYHPRQGLDAGWLNTIVALSVFAFENYHDEKDLAKSVIAPDAYDNLRSIYERTYGGPEDLMAMLGTFGERPLLGYFRDEYRDPAYFAASRYGQLLAEAETYRQLFKSPVKAFYGTQDEVVKEPIGQLSATYQTIMIGNEAAPSRNTVVAEPVPGADHRRTFITAAPAAKAWMDGLRAPDSGRPSGSRSVRPSAPAGEQ